MVSDGRGLAVFLIVLDARNTVDALQYMTKTCGDHPKKHRLALHGELLTVVV